MATRKEQLVSLLNKEEARVWCRKNNIEYTEEDNSMTVGEDEIVFDTRDNIVQVRTKTDEPVSAI